MPKAKNSTEQVTLNVKASPTVQAALLEGEERSQSEVLRSAIHAYIAAKQAARNRNAHGVPDHVVAFIPTPLELEEMVAAAGGTPVSDWFGATVAASLRRTSADRVTCPAELAAGVREHFVEHVVPVLARLAARSRRTVAEVVAATVQLPLLDLVNEFIAEQSKTWTNVDIDQNT